MQNPLTIQVLFVLIAESKLYGEIKHPVASKIFPTIFITLFYLSIPT